MATGICAKPGVPMLTFLALSATAAATLVVAAAALVLLLYLIRPARTRVAVASMLIWQRIAARSRTRSPRRRWLLSLLLSLLIALCLASAATCPRFGAAEGRLVVVMDNTASLAARTADGRTRWARAVAAADALIASQGDGQEVLLLDTASRESPSGFVTAREARDRLARMAPSARSDGSLPPLPSGDMIRALHLFTDGVGVGSVPAGVTVHSVFEPADNVGITGFDARPVPGDPTRVEAFLQIANTSATSKTVSVDVRGGGGFQVSREVDVAADTVVNLTLDVTSYAQGPLRARIQAPGDAFELDDSAYCLVLPHRVRRVLLVTPGRTFLEDSLRLLPGVELTVRTPAQYASSSAFDAYVFDRFAPPEPPAAGALLFRPPPIAWLDTRWRASAGRRKLAWDATHPLSAGLIWRDVRVESPQVARVPADRAVVSVRAGADSGDAVLVTGQALARWAAAGFTPDDSNLPLQAGFPVFLGTALQWLAPGPAVDAATVGPVAVRVPDARVFDLEGKAVPVTVTPAGALFEAARPGLYRIEGGAETRFMAVNTNDLRMAQINRQRMPAPAAATASAPVAGIALPEAGLWLLGLALVLLFADWAAFSRGLTE